MTHGLGVAVESGERLEVVRLPSPQHQAVGDQAGLTQLQNQIGALSGVNLNDEAASLETLEQSYQAASKLFTVLADVISTALNLGVETAFS